MRTGTAVALILALWLPCVPARAARDPLETGMPPAEAARTMRERAAQWFELGESYYYGTLVPQSYEQAAVLYRLAADYGHAEALYSLGYLYSQGAGVDRDPKAALDLFRRGAQAGSVLAMHNLAYLYDVGEGVPRDDYEAYRLYRLAVDGGDVEAMVNLAIMLDEGRGTIADPRGAARYLVEAYRLGVRSAREWLFEHADEWAVNTRREVQRIVLEAGFYRGDLDGLFDDEMRAALRTYGGEQ